MRDSYYTFCRSCINKEDYFIGIYNFLEKILCDKDKIALKYLKLVTWGFRFYRKDLDRKKPSKNDNKAVTAVKHFWKTKKHGIGQLLCRVMKQTTINELLINPCPLQQQERAFIKWWFNEPFGCHTLEQHNGSVHLWQFACNQV